MTRAATLVALFLAAAVVLSSAACTRTAEISLRTERPSDLPQPVLECTTATDVAASDCVRALAWAVERRDRASVGQILLARSVDLPDGPRRAVVRAALWLNPSPWVPESMIALVDDIAAVEVPVFDAAPGALFFFHDAEGPAPAPDTVLAATPLARVDLPIPQGTSPLAGDELVATLVASAGGVAGAWQTERNAPVRVVAATPLFARILGFQPAGVTDAWDAMILAGQADAAAIAGRPIEAWTLLGQALDALPASAPACSTRGALLLARYKIGTEGTVSDASDALDELETVCIGGAASVEVAEGDARDYLRELVFLETSRRAAGTHGIDDQDLYIEPRREAYLDEVDVLATRLEGRRGALLRALAEQTRAAWREAPSVCETGFAAERAAEERAAAERLDRLGRADAARRVLASDVVDADGHLVRTAIGEQLARAGQPHNAWHRGSMLAAVLTAAARARWLVAERELVVPVCNAMAEETLRQVRADTAEGATFRNVERVVAMYAHERVCGRAEANRALLDEVLATAVARGGSSASLEVVAASLSEGAQALLLSTGVDAVTLLGDLVVSLDVLEASLGDTPEDRVLRATFDVLGLAHSLAIGRASRAQLVGKLEALVEAAAPLAEREPDPEADLVVRIAPGLRLAALAAIAAAAMLEGDLVAIQTSITALEAVQEHDLRALLLSFEAPDHSAAMTRILLATRSLAFAYVASSPQTLEAVRDPIAEALREGPDEQGFWALGLDLARFLLIEAWAFEAGSVMGPEAALEGAALASTVLERTLERAISGFELQGTGWEMTRALPALNVAMVQIFVVERDTAASFAAIAPALDAALAVALPAMAEATAGVEPGLADVAMLFARAASEVGVQRLFESTDEVVDGFVTALLGSLDTMPVEMRAYSRVLVAALLYGRDVERASQLFAEAEAELAETHLRGVAYLPRVIEAALHVRLGGELERARGALEKVVAYGDEALGCDRAHAVHALLPALAWTHEALGQHETARATLEQWLALVAADNGFYGDARLACQLSSQRGTLLVNLDAGQTLSTIVMPRGTPEGAFQVGAGFISFARDNERLYCTGSPLAALRPDLSSGPLLAASVWASRAGDAREAEAWLVAGLGELQQLLHGSPLVLGAAAGGLAKTREGSFDAIPHWVVASSALDGHLWLARVIGASLGTMEPPQPEADAEAEPQLPPSYLDQLGLEPYLVPVVELVQAMPWASREALDALYAEARAAVPDEMATELALLYSSDVYLKGGDPAVALALLEDLAPSDDGVERAQLASWRMLVESGPGTMPKAGDVQAVVDELVGAGLPAEAAAFLERMLHAALAVDDRTLAYALGDLALERIPCEAAGVVCVYLHLALLPLWHGSGRMDGFAASAALVLEHGRGRIDPGWEMNLRQTQLSVLASTGNGAALREAVDTLLEMMLGAGINDLGTLQLLALDLALDIHAEDPEASAPRGVERLDQLIAELDAMGALPQELRTWAGKLRAALGQDPAQARELAQRYVNWILLSEPL